MLTLVTVVLVSSARAEQYDKNAARAAFERGTRHYNLAEYPKALDEFREAYRIYPEPSFLFNIAQCYRQVGDKPNAIRFYRTYLRETPNAPNRDDVNRLISTLERAVAEEQMAKTNQPAPAPSPAAAASPARTDLTASPPPPPAPRPLVKRGWFWAAVAGGAAAVGLAVGLGVGLGVQKDPSPTYGTILKN